MKHSQPAAGRRLLTTLALACCAAVTLAACSLPGARQRPAQQTWMLEDVLQQIPDAAEPACAVLRVGTVRAAPGYNSSRMLYQRSAARLEWFAWQTWADTPAAMLTGLIARRLQRSGDFRAVVTGNADVPADLRLDTSGMRLVQTFDGDKSEVALELTVQLIQLSDRRLHTSRSFSYNVAASRPDPAAGVAAANSAVRQFLDDVQDLSNAVAGALACGD